MFACFLVSFPCKHVCHDLTELRCGGHGISIFNFEVELLVACLGKDNSSITWIESLLSNGIPANGQVQRVSAEG